MSTKLDAENCGSAEPLGIKGKPKSEASSPSRHLVVPLILPILKAVRQEDKTLAACQNIVQYVAELSPEERSQLISNPQVQHYLHRLVQHAAKNHCDDEVVEKLAEYFPSKIAYYREKELPCSYSYSDVEPEGYKDVTSSPQMPKTESTQAHLFQYKPNTLAATFRAPQINLEDIRRASAVVALEVRKLEKDIYGGDVSPAKRSLSIGLHKKKPSSRYVKLSVSKSPSAEKPALVPVLRPQLADSHFRVSKSGETLFPATERRSLIPLQTAPVSVDGVPLKNAFDVIEAFASGLLRSDAESVYLNYSHSDHCSPYDLSVTLKTKVMPEHFVMSNFGIIHVYPDGMSDFQTFAYWLREASMFTLMRQIPFFKEYKLKRSFWQWYRVVKSAILHRLTLKLNHICIRFLPIYAEALLKLQYLSTELRTIPLHHLKPLGGYTVDAMEHSLQGSQTKAQQFLLKYFKYCQRIVCSAIDSSRKHASDLESEHHHQQFVPEVPLSIQRKKHEKLERDLEAATYQVERIPAFVCLAEQIVYNCLLQLAHQAVDSWKEVFLCPIPRQASKGFQIPMPLKSEDKAATKAGEQEEGNYFLFSSLEIDSSGI